MLTRSETTYLLSCVLEKQILYDKYWANEVSIRRGQPDYCRIDYMTFKAANESVGGIEQGKFTCYEIKSCLDDYNSGHGLNFICDYNYIVTTVETCKQLPQFPSTLGCYVLLPNDVDSNDVTLVFKESMNPSPLTLDIDAWKLYKIVPCVSKTKRFHSNLELLYSMLRAGRKPVNQRMSL